MYNNLKNITITCSLYGNNYNIIFDNDNKLIKVNDTVITDIDYNNYLVKLLRIIRFYNIDKNNNIHNTMIKIKEVDNEYLYYIDDLLPDNYDSFIDLLMELINL